MHHYETEVIPSFTTDIFNVAFNLFIVYLFSVKQWSLMHLI